MNLARSYGIGPLRGVQTTAALDRLVASERMAVVLHELAHLYYGHPAKRLKWALTLRVLWDFERVRQACIQQEFEADSFVKEYGHGQALARFLIRNPSDGGAWHPSNQERLYRLAGVTRATDQPTERAKEQSNG